MADADAKNRGDGGGLARGKRRSAEKEAFWRGAVERLLASGLTVRAFCQRERLVETSFHYWRRELKRRDGEAIAGHASAPGVTPAGSSRADMHPDEPSPARPARGEPKPRGAMTATANAGRADSSNGASSAPASAIESSARRPRFDKAHRRESSARQPRFDKIRFRGRQPRGAIHARAAVRRTGDRRARERTARARREPECLARR